MRGKWWYRLVCRSLEAPINLYPAPSVGRLGSCQPPALQPTYFTLPGIPRGIDLDAPGRTSDSNFVHSLQHLNPQSQLLARISKCFHHNGSTNRSSTGPPGAHRQARHPLDPKVLSQHQLAAEPAAQQEHQDYSRRRLAQGSLLHRDAPGCRQRRRHARARRRRERPLNLGHLDAGHVHDWRRQQFKSPAQSRPSLPQPQQAGAGEESQAGGRGRTRGRNHLGAQRHVHQH